MFKKLFSFHGGIKPDYRKEASLTRPIARIPLPERLVIPLHQSIGGTAHARVEVGEKVLKGQLIGSADGNKSTGIHASTSGTVVAVGMALMPHSSGLSEMAVTIAPDGEDRWMDLEPVHYRSLPEDEVRDFLRDAGIVGLGGAVFPSHMKLRTGRSGSVTTLVINGAECEPFITCDDVLMRERAAGIVDGIAAMRYLLRSQEVLIGIEDNKPEAIAAMRAAVAAAAKDFGSARVEVVAIPTRYPAGGAKQLIRVLTGIEVPQGKRSTEYGVQCFNVGTAYAVHEALALGRPLVSRIVTVAGNVEAAGNFEVPFGTPMDHVVRQARALPDTDRYIMGGPMMGFRMPAYDVPVVKATNCILVGSPALFPPPGPEMPCIRCGECAKACPSDLAPFELYWHSRANDFDKAQAYHLFDCIECGCCAYVCPSRIPLVDYYRYAKSEIHALNRDKAAADTARERFEARNARHEREKAEKAAKLAAKAAATREQLAAKATTDGGAADAAAATTAAASADDAKKALIAAAMARAKAQREAAQPKNTEALSTATQAEIAEIEARRAASTGSEPSDKSEPSVQP